VPPEQTEVVVKEAADAGISRVWMQQGSESDAATAYCRSRGMTVVSGQCILMSLGQADIRDREDRWIRGRGGDGPE